jgi:lysophospholipid acyltransferase (LPLAT)-like uncharacterized protein
LSKINFLLPLSFIFFIYLKFVHLTNNWKYYNSDIPEDFWKKKKPFIWVHWHGQSLMLPSSWDYKKQDLFALVSRHGDGNFIGSILSFFGIKLVRGAGNPKKLGIKEKGGAMALRSMLKVLKSGHSVSLTADQPPGPGKISGLGVITLSKISGVPIIPVSASTSKRYEFNNWDNFTINLPFGKGAVVWGDPILVDPKSSKEEMEKKRKILEKNLLKIFKESKENL